MFAISNILLAIAKVSSYILNAYTFIIIAAAVLSWVQPNPYNPIVRILYNLTEPVFYRVRKYLPYLLIGGLDLSPLIVLLAIQFINLALINSLIEFAISIR